MSLDAKDIKRIVDEFKQTNGNNNFTNKDLIIAANHNIEKLGEKLDKQILYTYKINERVSRNSIAIRYHKWLIGILFTLGLFLLTNILTNGNAIDHLARVVKVA